MQRLYDPDGETGEVMIPVAPVAERVRLEQHTRRMNLEPVQRDHLTWAEECLEREPRRLIDMRTRMQRRPHFRSRDDKRSVARPDAEGVFERWGDVDDSHAAGRRDGAWARRRSRRSS